MEQVVMTENSKILNRNGLKILAIIAMTMDHIAPILFESDSVIFLIFRTIGRLTFPIMAYMLADGFRYTHNLKGYLLRMFWFSLVSWFTFSFLETGSFLPIQLMSGQVTDYTFSYLYIPSIDKTLCICSFSVITNLFLALLSLTVLEKTTWKLPIKLIVVALMLVVSLDGDWMIFPILFAIVFYYLKDHKTAKWIVYVLVSALYVFNILLPTNLFDLQSYFAVQFKLYRIGVLLVPLVIEFLYSGKAGKKSKASKWFFYIYYPAHQVLLGILNLLM